VYITVSVHKVLNQSLVYGLTEGFQAIEIKRLSRPLQKLIKINSQAERTGDYTGNESNFHGEGVTRFTSERLR